MIERPMNEIDEDGEDDLRRMQRHPENEQHDENGTQSVDDGAVLNGRVFFVGDRNRSGQPHPRAVFAREIEILGRLPDRVGRRLAGLQRIVVEHRLEFDEGAAIGIGQRLVADEFTPGERPGAGLQHIFDGLGDQVEGPLGAVELDLSALDAGQSGFQRAGQSADAGIAGHDFDQRRGGFELPGQPADLRYGQEQQPVLFKKFSRAERLDRFEILRIAGQSLRQRSARRAGQFRRRRVHHGKDRPVPVECFAELVVALAPVQVGRNQRVNVGVDREVPGCVVARRYRKDRVRSGP